MESKILESLELVGYKGDLIDQNCLSQAIYDDKINTEFRNLVSWISNEIAGLGNFDERVSKDDDLNTFLLELSGFLKEIQCPYNIFMAGPVSSRFNTAETRFLLLEFLLEELMAQKMSNVSRTKDTKKDLAITLHETPTAAALKEIAITLNLGKPPDNITSKQLFEKINNKFDEIIARTNGMKRIGKPLFCPKTRVSDENWNKLADLQKNLDAEYDLRRKMLLTRLDCTVQSFQWSEKIKGKEAEITERFAAKRQKLEQLTTGGQRTGIPALLAARDNLAIIEKTSSANVRRNTRSKIQRHVMGSVPDRGGRAYEHQPPPPEMPSWQKNRAQGGGGQGGGRGRGNHNQGGNRGGYQNHGNNQPWQNQQQQQGYNRGGYQNNQGYSNQGQHQQQRDSYDNRQNYNQQGGYHHDNNRQNRGGGSRVQGGWSQRGANNDYNNQQSYHSGGRDDNSYQQRGHSNYNRGGRR
ncbi:protein FAM98A [Culicoides brevitarsis]|uniref:protein FAM98A n=1 Tax=Culicoides brevitarsis TaxID=469753 RepID=UPI00307B963C